jgi:hypothetical protein
MAIRSRAARRPCQKSNMGLLYQQWLALSGGERLESQSPSDAGERVTRRLLKRFSSGEGMGGQRCVLLRVTAGPGLRVNVVCRCYIRLAEADKRCQTSGLQCTEFRRAGADRCRKRPLTMVVRLVEQQRLYPLEDVAGYAPGTGRVLEARQTGHARVCGGQGRNGAAKEPNRRLAVSSQRRHAAIGISEDMDSWRRWWGFLSCFLRPCYRYVGCAARPGRSC